MTMREIANSSSAADDDESPRARAFREFRERNLFGCKFTKILSRSSHHHVDLSSIDENMEQDFALFLLTCPKIETVDFCYFKRALRSMRNKQRNVEIDQQLKLAAARARIERLVLDPSCPAELLEAFKANPNVKCVRFFCSTRYGYFYQETLIRLLRVCKNATFQVHFKLYCVWEEDLGVQEWLKIADEVNDLDNVTELTIFGTDSNPFFGTVLPKLFQSTSRKLTLWYRNTRGPCGRERFQSEQIFSLLTKPESKIESINIGAMEFWECDIQVPSEALEAFVEHAPHFSPALKSLSFDLRLGDCYTTEEARDWKRKVLNALWRNRSLTRIELTGTSMNDQDLAFVERIVQRNQSSSPSSSQSSSDPLNGLRMAVPASEQMPNGFYVLLTDPTTEIIPLVDSAYFCGHPFSTCVNPNQEASPVHGVGLVLEPGCACCINFQKRFIPRLLAAGYTAPNHNLIHWGGPHNNEHHAYMIGPIFTEDEVAAIMKEVDSCPLEMTRMRIHRHTHTTGGPTEKEDEDWDEDSDEKTSAFPEDLSSLEPST